MSLEKIYKGKKKGKNKRKKQKHWRRIISRSFQELQSKLSRNSFDLSSVIFIDVLKLWESPSNWKVDENSQSLSRNSLWFSNVRRPGSSGLYCAKFFFLFFFDRNAMHFHLIPNILKSTLCPKKYLYIFCLLTLVLKCMYATIPL